MKGNGLETAESTLYGRGVFTTIAVRRGEPFLWDKHWRRLTLNTQRLGLDISAYSEGSVLGELAKELEQNSIDNGRARITFADHTPSRIWNSGGDKRCALSVISADCRQIAEQLRLGVSPHCVNTTSPLVGVKSCNYLEHLMAFEQARGSGFDEAIRANERGEVTSACMANVFWFVHGKLFTPSLPTGCLAGTTREFVMENLECEEVEASIDELRNADQIFLTSAGLGVVAVAEFEGRKLANGPHPILELMPR